MERLTKKDGAGRNIVEVQRFSNGDDWIISEMADGITIKFESKAIDKLSQFEDFMEEQGFESLEDLENVIGYNYFADGCDEQGNEIHEQRWITYKEVFKETMNEKRELKQENKALKSRWQELKEYIYKYKVNNTTWDIIEKMEELEKEK